MTFDDLPAWAKEWLNIAGQYVVDEPYRPAQGVTAFDPILDIAMANADRWVVSPATAPTKGDNSAFFTALMARYFNPPSPWGNNFPNSNWPEIDGISWGISSDVFVSPGVLRITGDGASSTIQFTAFPSNFDGLAGTSADCVIEFAPTGVSADVLCGGGAGLLGDETNFQATASLINGGTLLTIRNNTTATDVATTTIPATVPEGVHLKCVGTEASRTYSLLYKVGGVWIDSGLSHVDAVVSVGGVIPTFFSFIIQAAATVPVAGDVVDLNSWSGSNTGTL
ncbi:hypothetical protein [uncultured Paraglaciecola sp.]|uniref:hypothetical protein n=1 Tax=uncultured Paraglaciecola sp. TaxID=1765024 RepID=UPI002603ECFB|nr:hypothetical protein [uncultured Paraglaciecola sp.]